MAKKKQEVSKKDNHLEAEYDEVAQKLFKIRNEYRMTRKLEKPHLLRQYKKDIARILTTKNAKKGS